MKQSRPENSNRRIRGGFLFGMFECFTRFITKYDKSACILVLIRTALMLVLIYSDSIDFAQNAPNLWGIPDNLPAFGTWKIYLLSPRPEINENTAVNAVSFDFAVF